MNSPIWPSNTKRNVHQQMGWTQYPCIKRKASTTSQPSHTLQHRPSGTDPVPHNVLSRYCNVTLCIDIMFVKKVAFLITYSRNIWFGMLISTIKHKVMMVLQLYHHRVFQVKAIFSDLEFEHLRPWFPMLHTAAQGEHVPEIEI